MLERKYVIDNVALMEEWDQEKNNSMALSPDTLTCGSKKVAWWKCKHGHEWQERIEVRNRGYGCPYCSGKRPIIGINDFATVHPELLCEWDYEKNTFLPSEILQSSGKKIWWKCEKGHSWIATPNNRHRGTGCPVCSKEANTSFPEIALFFYLSQCIFAEHRKKIDKKEVDIYIPDLKIGIEYDGIFFHEKSNVKERDQAKKAWLNQKGIFLIRIRESDKVLLDYENGDFQVIYDANYSYINTAITAILHFINTKYRTRYTVDINISRDRIAILNQYKSLKLANSLQANNPQLSAEWNYKRNGDLSPEYFSTQSKYSVWWKCKRGHEWQASIYSRSSGNGCPYCANQKLLTGYNDMPTIAPHLVKEWNHSKNGNLKPYMVGGKSRKKVWWVCDKGHEWQTTVSHRLSGDNCPICSNKKVLAGYNDFSTWCIKNKKEFLLVEFDCEKNPFLPTEITPFSGKKIWWRCEQGHSYATQLTHRTQMGTSCPFCSHKALLQGYNDLATTHPQIAAQWDYSKNGAITPSEVMAGSNKTKYWFICPNGHSYSSTLLNQKKGRGCPKCYKETPRYSRKKQINVYLASDHSYYGSFIDAKDLCDGLGLEYEKNYSNIGAVCRRRQKTLLKKYILRYASDDEFSSDETKHEHSLDG